jgi:hypothetical protein
MAVMFIRKVVQIGTPAQISEAGETEGVVKTEETPCFYEDSGMNLDKDLLNVEL